MNSKSQKNIFFQFMFEERVWTLWYMTVDKDDSYEASF